MRTLSFHELWARVPVQFTDQYRLVLRLVVISHLIPADTSECERIFSLMNDVKTSEPEEPDAVAHHGLQNGERQQGQGIQSAFGLPEMSRYPNAEPAKMICVALKNLGFCGAGLVGPSGHEDTNSTIGPLSGHYIGPLSCQIVVQLLSGLSGTIVALLGTFRYSEDVSSLSDTIGRYRAIGLSGTTIGLVCSYMIHS